MSVLKSIAGRVWSGAKGLLAAGLLAPIVSSDPSFILGMGGAAFGYGVKGWKGALAGALIGGGLPIDPSTTVGASVGALGGYAIGGYTGAAAGGLAGAAVGVGAATPYYAGTGLLAYGGARLLGAGPRGQALAVLGSLGLTYAYRSYKQEGAASVGVPVAAAAGITAMGLGLLATTPGGRSIIKGGFNLARTLLRRPGYYAGLSEAAAANRLWEARAGAAKELWEGLKSFGKEVWDSGKGGLSTIYGVGNFVASRKHPLGYAFGAAVVTGVGMGLYEGMSESEFAPMERQARGIPHDNLNTEGLALALHYRRLR